MHNTHFPLFYTQLFKLFMIGFLVAAEFLSSTAKSFEKDAALNSDKITLKTSKNVMSETQRRSREKGNFPVGIEFLSYRHFHDGLQRSLRFLESSKKHLRNSKSEIQVWPDPKGSSSKTNKKMDVEIIWGQRENDFTSLYSRDDTNTLKTLSFGLYNASTSQHANADLVELLDVFNLVMSDARSGVRAHFSPFTSVSPVPNLNTMNEVLFKKTGEDLERALLYEYCNITTTSETQILEQVRNCSEFLMNMTQALFWEEMTPCMQNRITPSVNRTTFLNSCTEGLINFTRDYVDTMLIPPLQRSINTTHLIHEEIYMNTIEWFWKTFIFPLAKYFTVILYKRPCLSDANCYPGENCLQVFPSVYNFAPSLCHKNTDAKYLNPINGLPIQPLPRWHFENTL